MSTVLSAQVNVGRAVAPFVQNASR